MGRSHRIIFPGAIYHVYDRGNEKMRIFKDDLERKAFLQFLRTVKERYKFKLHAYALMPNHYHFLMEPDEIPLSKIMQVFKTKYSHYFNFRNNRVGHLFEGRYKAKLVENNEYLEQALCYIHLNPVKSRLVESIDDYTWSSHAEVIGASKEGISDIELLIEMFGSDKKAAIKEYRRHIGHAWKTKTKLPYEEWFDKLIAGSKEFAGEVLHKAQKAGLKVSVQAFRGNWAGQDDIINRVCEGFEVGREEMITKKGKWNTAKLAAIYLFWKNTAFTQAQIALVFNNLHPTGVKRAVDSAREKMLDNSEFRALVEAVENRLTRKSNKSSAFGPSNN